MTIPLMVVLLMISCSRVARHATSAVGEVTAEVSVT
jgi:hypothetical protein